MAPVPFLRAATPSRLRWAALALVVALAGCGDSTGRDCERDSDCDDDQVCAPIVAGCASLNDCPGICGSPCDTDDECDDGLTCQSAAGSPIAICRESSDPGDD